jgi:hypothetical protein
MAMPSSGSLGLISAPQTCGSIACGVTGSNTAVPYSLNTLSATAGKSAPHSMLEFYGYAGATTFAVDVLAYWITGSGCMSGTATLNCCTGSAVCYCNFMTCCNIGWCWDNVSAGCYYVDFSNVYGYDFYGNQVIVDYYYSDSFGSGMNACTACFSSANSVSYDLYST